MDRKDRKVPTPAEVLSKWKLPNIVEETSAVGPVEAFRLFMAYAELALEIDFERELNRALEWDAFDAGEILLIVPEAVEGSALVGQPFFRTPKEVRERITQEVSTALRDRIAPLLPGIQSYVSNRPNDPATVNRLGWMAEQIEAIPYALEGGALWRSREQPEGFPRDRKFEPMAWKELNDGLLEILNTATVNPPTAQPADTDAIALTLAGIQWKGRVQVLAWLLRELAEKDWIEAPTHKTDTTRWKAGDINASAYAKITAPHFQGIKVSGLEQELKSSVDTTPAHAVDGWKIPERPE